MTLKYCEETGGQVQVQTFELDPQGNVVRAASHHGNSSCGFCFRRFCLALGFVLLGVGLVCLAAFVAISVTGNSSFSFSSDSAAQCQGTTTLDGPVGTLRSGSPYANNANCAWLIQPHASSQAQIELGFTQMMLEADYDFVYIYDGSSSSAPLLVSYTGHTVPPPVRSTGNTMYVKFTSDSSVNDNGFVADYQVINNVPSDDDDDEGSELGLCTGAKGPLRSSTGTIGSGGEEYINNMNCSWLIQPDGAASVMLEFVYLETERFFDPVCVYNGATQDSPRRCFTGRHAMPPAPLISDSGSMLVTFQSDNSRTARGFLAHYHAEGAHSDPCLGDGDVLTTEEGEISFDQFDYGDSPTSHPCQWLIQPNHVQGSVIQLYFDYFMLYHGVLRVYDGASTSDHLLGTFTNYEVEPVVLGTKSSMLLVLDGSRMQSSDAEEFAAFYQLIDAGERCHGKETMTEAEGVLSSGVTPYLPNMDCSWLIQPNPPMAVSLQFLEFDTEQLFDTVSVYDGASSDSHLLGRFSGSTVPPSLRSSGPSMFVEFQSDSSVQGDGFLAAYSSVSEENQCGSSALSGASGELNFPSGSEHYLPSTSCEWTITGTSGMVLMLEWTRFDTENFFDVMEVYDGLSTSSDPLLEWSGHTLPEVVHTSHNTVTITFSSDSSVQYTGFTLVWTSVPANSHEDRCHGQRAMTQPSGSFGSGHGYDANAECSWIIIPSHAQYQYIKLTFPRMALENDASIQVYEGTSTNAPLLSTIHADSPVPEMITTTGPLGDTSPALFVVFHGGSQHSSSGSFSASYQLSGDQCGGLETLTYASGEISTGDPPYAPYNSCGWQISPASNTGRVELIFGTMDLAPGSAVCVFDDSLEGDLIDCFSGNALPAPIVSTSSSMAVFFFTSDNDGGHEGFSAIYGEYSSHKQMNLLRAVANPARKQVNRELAQEERVRMIQKVAAKENKTPLLQVIVDGEEPEVEGVQWKEGQGMPNLRALSFGRKVAIRNAAQRIRAEDKKVIRLEGEDLQKALILIRSKSLAPSQNKKIPIHS